MAIPRTIEPWQNPTIKPYIRVDGLSKMYGDRPAVSGVSLSVYQGELFSLLGASGCGKTTLLRLLAGFDVADSGTIFIDGVDMSGIPPYSRPVNMMFQSYALFPHMTAIENVEFGLRQKKLSKAQRLEQSQVMLNLVQMWDKRERKPHELSGGERQRVALARSLAPNPKLLLLDEPLGALDKNLRERTQFELVNIQEQLGITFIMVTHDQEEAMTMSSRIAVMEDGKIKQVGIPTEVYEYPNSYYVANFVGTINLFSGVVIEDDTDHTLISSVELGADIFVNHSAQSPIGANVWVAIRPEKITLLKEPRFGVNSAKGIVKEIAYLGDVSIYHILLQSGKVAFATAPNLVRIAERHIQWEDEVYLHWDPGSGVILHS